METKLSFARAPQSVFGGSSLQAFLDVSMVDLRAKYGPADRDAYVDEDAGYEGDDMSFVASDGQTVRVYSRWGSARIGATNYAVAVQFAAWLVQEGFQGAAALQVDHDRYLAALAAHAAVDVA